MAQATHHGSTEPRPLRTTLPTLHRMGLTTRATPDRTAYTRCTYLHRMHGPLTLSRPARSSSTSASQPHLPAQPSPHEPASLHTPLHRTTPVPCTHTLTPTLTLTLLTSTPSAPHLQHGLTLALAPNPPLSLTPAQIPAPAPTLTAAPEP